MTTPKRNLFELFLAGELIMRSVAKETKIPISKLSALRTGAQVCDTHHAHLIAKWADVPRAVVLAKLNAVVKARIAHEADRDARGDVATDRYGIRNARNAKRGVQSGGR